MQHIIVQLGRTIHPGIVRDGQAGDGRLVGRIPLVDGRQEQVLNELYLVLRDLILFLLRHRLNLLRPGQLGLDGLVVRIIRQDLLDYASLSLEVATLTLLSRGKARLRRGFRFSVII